MSIPRNLSIHADTLNSDGNFTSITDTGNLTFTGTGNRITGDFSNGTASNRVIFQTSTASANTRIGMMPNAASTGTAGPVLYSTNDPNNASVFDIRITDGSQAALISTFNGTGTYLPMAFQTGGSERMRLDTSGNVGIGTSSGTARLNVNGGTSTSQIRWEVNNAAFTNEVSTNAAANAYVYKSNDASYHVWKLSSSTAMTLDTSGNLGISTSSPSQRLQVGDGTADTRASFRPNNAFAIGIANGAGFAGWIGGSGTTDVMVFSSSGGTERMRIDASGNLGIGTSSPSAKLTVVGTVKSASTTQSSLYLSDSAQTSGFLVGRSLGSGNTQDFFIYDTVAALTRMVIDSSGGIGIGTISPATTPKITVQGGGANGYGGIRILSDTTYSNGANYQAYGRRGDGNGSGSFAGGVLLARVNTAPAAITSGMNLGRVAFGGSYDGTDANIVYGAQITGQSSGTYSSTSAATDLVFYTTPSGTAGGTTTGTADFGTERMRIDSSGNVLVTNPAGLGYGTGSGGTVTQATSRTTAVTINKPTGKITMFTATGSPTWSNFTVNNSLFTTTDTVILTVEGGNANTYMLTIVGTAAGSFIIGFATTGGVASDTPRINFAIIKGSTA